MRIDCLGLLFDCDGVLVDSAADDERAWTQWAAEHGLSTPDVLVGIHGRRSQETVALFLPEDQRATGLARIDELEIEGAGATRPIPGAPELLGALPAHGWAVVTSAAPILLRARLRGAGVPIGPVLVTADDVSRGKPAPDGYLRAADLLGQPISACVVFEDSPTGVASARSAGAAAVIGVGERALPTDADVVVADLRGVNWDGVALLIDDASLLRGR
jgi:sugar-phosphatase